MKNLLIEKLNSLVNTGELEFGFKKITKDFVLKSYVERDNNLITCVCRYIENNAEYEKLVEVVV